MNLISDIKCEYNLICRICLVQSTDTNNMNLKMFEYCTGINITEGAHSTQICEKCELSLNDFSLFKRKCIESHESFIRMYSENTIEHKIEPSEDNVEQMLDLNENTQEENDVELVTELDVYKDDESHTGCSADDLDTQKMSDFSESETSIDKNRKKSTKTRKKTPKKKPLNFWERVICPHCGKTYNKTFICLHIRNSHSNALSEEEKFQCDVCKNTYKNKESLKDHKRNHRDLSYACKICDKPFKNYHTRRTHMVSAHGAPHRYNCNMCDYKTDRSQANSIHMRQHSGEQPFECKECKRTFIAQSNLTRHMVTHSNENNFICEYCNKAFGGLRHLKAHIRIHTQERNYVCPAESCGKSFIQNHVLKSHMKANHPDVEIPPSETIVSKKYKNVTAIQK